MNLFMDTFLSYIRLILYPALSLTFIIFAFSGKEGGNAKSTKLHIFVSGLFLMFWGTSIIGIIDGDYMLIYNNIGIVPYLIFLLVYTWIIIKRHNEEWLIETKKENANGNKTDV